MAVKVRTRLFLVVGTLLAASTLVSAFLSQYVTLVEVRELETRTAPSGRGDLDAAVREATSRSSDALSEGLALAEAATGRAVLALDASGELRAASNPRLARARVRNADDDGTLIAEFESPGGQSTLVLRGAPTREVASRDGVRLRLVLLPGPTDEPSAIRHSFPLWLWTTIATSVLAVPLVFAASRRILAPVSALTDAASRMQQGDLDIRVPVRGRDELAALGHAFNAMAARLAATDRARTQMVNDVAHELRSPVTNLRCTLEAIQDGLAAADRHAIDVLHEETLLLQRLIADLEDLARGDAGQLALQIQRVDVNEVVARAVASTPSSAGAATIVQELASDLAPVLADPARLGQVVRNLVSNARTHTPVDGAIKVRTAMDGAMVRVEVSDTGAGIDPAHLSHVFDRFYRADSSRARATGGAGLGLAIARQLVTLHGGTIAALSDGPGCGATFIVRLPARSSNS